MQMIFHAPFDKVAGKSLEIQLTAPASLHEILNGLEVRYPEMSGFLFAKSDELLSAHVMFLRNGRFLKLADIIQDRDRVDVLLPVSGG